MLVGGAVALMLSRDEPGVEVVAREYLVAVQEGREADRCELATPDLREQLWGERECRLLEDRPVRGTGSISLGEVITEPGSARAQVAYELEGVSTHRSGTLSLVEANGAWRVSAEE